MEITANARQTVPVRGNVVFTETPIGGCCSIIHREGSGLVKLRGLTQTQRRARFRASFGANIAISEDGTTEPIALAMTLDGEPVATTTMIATPANTTQYHNVGADIYIDVPAGCCEVLGVSNISNANNVDVVNANLIVERVA